MAFMFLCWWLPSFALSASAEGDCSFCTSQHPSQKFPGATKYWTSRSLWVPQGKFHAMQLTWKDSVWHESCLPLQIFPKLPRKQSVSMLHCVFPCLWMTPGSTTLLLKGRSWDFRQLPATISPEAPASSWISPRETEKQNGNGNLVSWSQVWVTWGAERKNSFTYDGKQQFLCAAWSGVTWKCRSALNLLCFPLLLQVHSHQPQGCGAFPRCAKRGRKIINISNKWPEWTV